MIRSILGIFHEPVEYDLESEFGTRFAIDVEETRYLDGASIYSGEAAGTNLIEKTDVSITDGAIITETVEDSETVVTDFYADFDAGYVSIDSSRAEFLWNWLEMKTATSISRAFIDLDRFARSFADREQSNTWQVGYSRDGGDDVGVAFHDAAQIEDATRGGLSQLGFSYLWDGMPVRGTIAASGYCAIFSGMSSEGYGKWLREELLPYASLGGEDEFTQQALLDESSDEETDEGGVGA